MIVPAALIRALGDLRRPRIFGVVALGVLLSLLLFAALQALVIWAVRSFGPDILTLPLIGEIHINGALSWGSLLLFPIMSIFLMAPVTAGFAGLFAEHLAKAVEDIHYPGVQGKSVRFREGLLESLAVMGAVMLVTLVSLIASLFLGPLASLLFYGLNGWLLGREFLQMAARRHLSAEATRALRKRLFAQATALGIVIALLATVPILNVFVPVLAAVGFTHLYHLSSSRTADRRG
ncbi:EI24 domain-containing protein [Paracoccus shanxieyensis]|uniref:EI24 domain-containing protein n=1 Tax=Paracoccus shanxieyensis TaxID=2675752 RepID=UPI0031345D06